MAVVDISFIRNPEFKAVDGQLYSAGIHPWDTHRDVTPEEWARLEELLRRPEFVAVGEAGVDLSGRGGMMFRQLNIFKRQIELSESLKKPIIVHCVKAEDVLCGLIRDLKPSQPWIIHGFRKKPQAAQQLLNAGCYISLGQHFNPDTLHAIPQERLLAERRIGTLHSGNHRNPEQHPRHRPRTRHRRKFGKSAGTLNNFAANEVIDIDIK